MRARILGAAALALAVSSFDAAQAQISDNTVKIGVLTDMSGPASDATGRGSLAAAQHIPGDQAFGPPDPACALVKK